MFENLIESKPKKERTIGEMVVSVIVHGVLIVGAGLAGLSAALAAALAATALFAEPHLSVGGSVDGSLSEPVT